MPGFLGPWEIGLIFLVALLVFGPKKLPALGRGIGSSLREFKDGLLGVDPRPELEELRADKKSSPDE